MFSEKEKKKAFGFHLMLDCYHCSTEKLDDINACYSFLDSLVDIIGMTKQTQPYVFRTPDGFKGKEGLSGWVPLVESGISLHTLTQTRFISLDIYSCKEFNCLKIVSFTKTYFCPDEIEQQYVLRGGKYR